MHHYTKRSCPPSECGKDRLTLEEFVAVATIGGATVVCVVIYLLIRYLP